MKNYTRFAILLIIFGILVTGLGIGLTVGQPGFGLIIGFGVSLLLWGLVLRK